AVSALGLTLTGGYMDYVGLKSGVSAAAVSDDVGEVSNRVSLDNQKYSQWNKYAEAGLAPADRVKLMDWDYAPTPEFYLKNKSVYDNPDYFNQLDGSVVYPGTPESALGRVDGSMHTDGFLNGKYEEVTLPPGTVIDRYGSNGSGRYFSPAGSSFESRALPPFMQNQPHTKYVVLKPLPVKAGTIAPWFDEPGMGFQYLTDTDMGIDYLKDNKYIKAIK
ncbi:TNT domain-containing protein, partial [Streptococcus ferus]|uniref:TNT domain-containing protein n=1 Tax=Streptococcus ferus TaxID=1345 RepID=UPI00359FD95B